MNCNFCNKKDIGHGHHCIEQKNLYSKFRDYCKLKKDLIINIHIDKNNGKSSLDILKFLVYEQNISNIDQYFTEKEIDILSQLIKEKSHYSKPVEIIRDLLKENKVFIKVSPSRNSNVKKALLDKYGVDNPGKIKHNIDKLQSRNLAEVYHVSENQSFNNYCKKVYFLTRKNRKKMKKPLNDYYTGLPFIEELCEPNLMQGDLYPTIDHKLSLYYCYINNITPEYCSSIDNLCWTYRYVNTKKNCLTEKMFNDTLLPIIKNELSKDIEKLIKEGYTVCK